MSSDQKFACVCACILGIAAVLVGSFIIGGLYMFGWCLLGFGGVTIVACIAVALDLADQAPAGGASEGTTKEKA